MILTRAASLSGHCLTTEDGDPMMACLKTFALLSGFCLLVACDGPPAQSPAPAQSSPAPQESDVPREELLGQGEAMAENLCAPCHAITRTDESPHASAPPLRDLSSKYPIQSLAGPLSRGILIDHPDMPEWQFEPQHVDALIAYLESIQTRQE